MAEAQGPILAAVLLLVSSGLHCSSPPPACPESCTCQTALLLNCSSSGLSSVPQHIQDSVTELDLSHNLLDSVTLHRPHHNLRNVWLGNNSITHFSLCIERNPGSQSVRGRYVHRLRPWSRRGCVSWAPTLQLLSVERNQLVQLPEGLEGSASLWVLQLSFNRISSLRPGDLSHLRQLKELHLQHNLITILHPQMFQDLAQLRVLDLSFNMLTSLHPLTYLSLRNIGADVELGGNRWQCDCSMRSLRRRMAYDSSLGLQAWSMVCGSPSILSGKDLLQLEEDDLNCFGTENRPELHRDVMVYSGSEILLSCSAQASGDQESINNDAVIQCEATKVEDADHAQQSAEDGRNLSGATDAGRTHQMEFEHIPDPVELEERRGSSSSSDSDRALKEDQVTQGDHTRPKSPQLDSVQQRADFSSSREAEVPQISIEGSSEIPGFSSEPFADWSPHTNICPDLWQENGEQFEFSDSVRSTSARSSSMFGSFNDSKLIVIPTSDRQSEDDVSSSSSHVSEDEPTQYTVNSEQEEEYDIERNHNKSEISSTCLEQDARPSFGSSSHSSDSDGESMQYTVKQLTDERDTRERVKPMPRTKWHGLSLGVTTFDLEDVPSIKRRLDIKAPPESSSSSNSEDERTNRLFQRSISNHELRPKDTVACL
ncbi:leucine-rich repeat-containing protein 66 [Lates japonicus]|uniref:Leucine-rich repeat-containing protein 66 n=1 Tax=Lates japonicus TaxID=270547 RepID=A0AAD3N3U6_LATJO|nr:leucine-rich repeat-containing protein 66 [Lates japonicus]